MPPNLSHHECVKGTSQIGCYVFLALGRTRTSVDSQDSEIDTWGNSRPLSVLAIGKTSQAFINLSGNTRCISKWMQRRGRQSDEIFKKIDLFIYLFIMYVYSVLPACMPDHQKRAPDSLQMVVSDHGVAGN